VKLRTAAVIVDSLIFCIAGKEMAVDSTFEFEKRRNIPTRYDRDLVSTTLRAMKRVEAIQDTREKRFHARRMAMSKALQVKQDVSELRKGVHLLAPAEKQLVESVVQERLLTRDGSKVALTEGAAAASGGGSAIAVDSDNES
jgi:hypothetical protein